MKAYVAVVSCLLVVLAATGCTRSANSVKKTAPERWQVDASVVKMSPEELFASSDAVVIGIVTGRPTAKRVPGPKTDSMPQGEPMVVSEWAVNVKEALKGDPPSKIVVQLEGGDTPELEIDMSDEARLSPGEEVFLYLNRAGDVYRVNGLFQGKYTVSENGRVTNKDANLNDTLDNLRKRGQK